MTLIYSTIMFYHRLKRGKELFWSQLKMLLVRIRFNTSLPNYKWNLPAHFCQDHIGSVQVLELKNVNMA